MHLRENRVAKVHLGRRCNIPCRAPRPINRKAREWLIHRVLLGVADLLM